MGNNFSKTVRHDVRKQGQKSRQHGTVQSTKLSRDQLIHKLETLREKLEHTVDELQIASIKEEMKQYNQQLDKFMWGKGPEGPF